MNPAATTDQPVLGTQPGCQTAEGEGAFALVAVGTVC